ncbi:MAG: DegT/DnrJ/EryC1/StrS family aminotransferase [Actinomycetota bacterium]
MGAMNAPRRVSIAQPAVDDAEWQALREPLETAWVGQGPVVARFEAAFAARHGVHHALATTSCTTALHLALAALGIGPGDEVIVPAFTWVATANAALYCGAKPVFVDVEASTYNIDPDLVAGAMTGNTRAIIPVHLFGLCADVPAIRDVVGPAVRVVEDAACAAGATHAGQPAGSLGDVACFSFHPRKTITTGEGGMLTTDDAELAERAASLRNHGTHPGPAGLGPPPPHALADVDEVGFNYRMSDLHAAVGLVQLGKLDGFVAERAQWAEWYREQLADLGWLHPPAVPAGHGWQSFVVVVDDDAPVARNELMARLRDRGVETRPGTHSVPTLTYFRKHLGLDAEEFATALRLQESSMAIPLHNRMTADDYGYVVETLRDASRGG